VLRDFHTAEDVVSGELRCGESGGSRNTRAKGSTHVLDDSAECIGTQLRSLSRRRVTADSPLLDRIGQRFLAAEPDVEETSRLVECVKKLPQKAAIGPGVAVPWMRPQCDEIAATMRAFGAISLRPDQTCQRDVARMRQGVGDVVVRNGVRR